MRATLKRRVISVPAVVLGFILATALLPVLLVGFLVADLVMGRPRLPLTRVLLFGWWYLLAETVGLGLLGMSWVVTIGRPAARARQAYAIQRWWAAWLVGAVKAVFGLRVEFDEAAARLSDGPYVVMMRHASIVDTLLPASLIAGPHRMRLRYVLKAELLADPCLDVAGNRLPNVFVRRGRRGADVPAVAELAVGLQPDEAVLIYPEGTRFTEAKLQRIKDSPNRRLASSAAGLTHVLPPRPGGAAALARAGHDIVFLVHRGLEGLAGVRDLLGGALIGARVKAEAWRVAAGDVDLDRVEEWLVDQWERVDHWVAVEAARAEA